MPRTMLEITLENLLREAIQQAKKDNVLPYELAEINIDFESPKNTDHGDLSSNIAMTLARPARMAPQKIAQAIVDRLPKNKAISALKIAGPGFINFYIANDWYVEQLPAILKAGEKFGHLPDKNQSCHVEFVSANPTGPLHVGHGRNAVLGDTLGNLMAAAGYKTTKEYYLNDAGVQMNNLGKSVILRIRELQGEQIELPEGCYKGDYIIDISKQLLASGEWNDLQKKSESEQYEWCGAYAGAIILDGIKADLAVCNIKHDSYYSESSLHESGKIDSALARLTELGHIYEKDDAIWFRSTTFGDDKDRVVRKSDGTLTYFAPDIAYHTYKFDNFDRAINVLGADHAGYVPRLKACVSALGKNPDRLDCVLTQMVNLTKNGEIISMSTRSGQFETLSDLVRVVGKDVVRYFYIMRSANAQLDFDLQLACEESPENPVFYIQYAHARICSLFSKCEESGYKFNEQFAPLPEQIVLPEEISLVKLMFTFPKVIEIAARELEPHRVAHYVLELARNFQAYYTMGKRDSRYRVLDQPPEVMQAKLYLLHGVRTVLRNALDILGLSAPDRMERAIGDGNE